MDHRLLQQQIKTGINLLSDGDGVFEATTAPSVQIVAGREVLSPGRSYTVKGVIREFKARDIDGDIIIFGDRRGIFTADSVISEGDRIYVDQEAYTVVDPRPVKPTGTVIAYRPVLRRAATYG
ncbi:head closure Hc1 [Escherichia phage Phagiculus]